jgi:hypothetical protein
MNHAALQDKLTAGLENSDSGTGMKKVAKLQVHVHRYTCTNKQHIYAINLKNT